MNLFPAWRDSLTILQPKSFKLFFLVTLKTVVDTFKVWIKYFWWLLIIQATKPWWWSALWNNYDLFNNPYLRLTAIACVTCINILLIVSILLAARPSVALKNCAYFRSYIWRIIYILPISFLMDKGAGFLINTVFYPYIGVPSALTPSVLLAIIMAGIVSWSVKIYVINYALFVLDTDGSIKQALKSLLYAFKIVAYNYPFYIIIYIVHGLIQVANHLFFLQIIKWLSPEPGSVGLQIISYGNMLVFALLTFFLYCFLTNFYIKKLHDQFTLYFGKNE